MSCVAYGAGKTVVRNMAAVLRPTRVGHDVVQVVALCAQRIWPLRAQIRRGGGVVHRSARNNGLRELIIPLQNVRIDRAVWPGWSCAAKFAIVVAGVAVGAENPCANQPPRRGAVLV